MATHSSIFAWRILWTRGAWGATVHRVAESQTRLKRLGRHHTIFKKKSKWLGRKWGWEESSLLQSDNCFALGVLKGPLPWQKEETEML